MHGIPIDSARSHTTSFRFVVAIAVSIAVAAVLSACSSDSDERNEYVIPSPTPGSIPPTFEPTITANVSGQLSVEFFVGAEGYTQQGSATLSEVEEGSQLYLSVRPAPGIIQQVSIREGRCDNIGRWLESVEHAVGGESLSHLPEISAADLLIGNHIITVAIPNGALSDQATCGEFPDIDIDSLR